METCGDGIVVSFHSGTLVYVSMSPECTCYCLEKSEPFVSVDHLAVSKSPEICLTGASDG